MIAVAVSYRRSFFSTNGLPHDCGVCRIPGCEDRRLSWGCETDTAEIQLYIPCQFCDEAKPGEGCEVCEGTGYEPIHRCPMALMDDGSVELVALHRHWPNALPYAGGIYDQPAVYVTAMRLIDSARGSMERTLASQREQAEKLRART